MAVEPYLDSEQSGGPSALPHIGGTLIEHDLAQTDGSQAWHKSGMH